MQAESQQINVLEASAYLFILGALLSLLASTELHQVPNGALEPDTRLLYL